MDLSATPGPNETWVFVPSSARETLWASAVECFRGQIPFVDSAPGETLNFDGGVTSAGQYAEWVVHIAPVLFKQLAAWALTAYAGKKLVDGFATEAGKDLWQGVRRLAELIAANLRHSKEAVRELKLLAPDTECNIEITFHVPDDVRLLNRANECFERAVLPLIGCLKSKVSHLDLTANNAGGGQLAANPVEQRRLNPR